MQPSGQLMWLKDPNCFGRPTRYSALDTIFDFNANPAGYPCSDYTARYSDWRLANLNELESLLNYQAGNMAGWLRGNGLLFKNVQSYYYQSSTSKDSGVWSWSF